MNAKPIYFRSRPHARFLMCENKKSFNTGPEALAANRGYQRAYWCPHCTKWHLTTLRVAGGKQ